jgi:hypothetical protein
VSAACASRGHAGRAAFVYGPPVPLPRRSCHALGLATLAIVTFAPVLSSRAHFVLQSPAAMTEQNQLGDPQKAPPCGDAGNAVATGAVTAYQAGDVVTITIDETIYHPGHYRVALAVNDISELPAEPPVTPNNTDCGTVPIQDPAVFPVLADGVLLHDTSFAEPQTIEVKLPDDISCDHCTLQVIQFMSNHGLNNPGGCFYHHCATISVQGAAAGSTGGGESGEGTAGTNATGSGGGGSWRRNGGDRGGADHRVGDGGRRAARAGRRTTAGTVAAAATARGGGGTASVFGLLGLLGLRARRRRASAVVDRTLG